MHRTGRANNPCFLYKTALKEKKRTVEENWEKWKTRALEWKTYTDKSQKFLFGRG